MSWRWVAPALGETIFKLPKFDSIDEYLETLTGDRRKALDKLRKTILSIIPKAEETISYRMPAFRLNGKVVAGFIATRKGCSYFPFSGASLTTLAEATSKRRARSSSTPRRACR